MDAIQGAELVEILDEAAETLQYIGTIRLSPAGWEHVDEAVRRMHEALDREDLAEVRRVRRDIDGRSYRHSTSTEPEDPGLSIPMPRVTCTARKDLVERIALVRQRYPLDSGEQTG